MTPHVGLATGGLDHGRQVLDFALDRVRRGVAAAASTSAVVVEDREVGRQDLRQAGVRHPVDGGAADQDHGGSAAQEVESDGGAVLRGDLVHELSFHPFHRAHLLRSGIGGKLIGLGGSGRLRGRSRWQGVQEGSAPHPPGPYPAVEVEPRALLHDEKGKGDPVVLVPGGLTGWLSWIPHQERLAARYRAIRVQPIHNELGSAGRIPEAGYDHDVERDAIALTMDDLGIEAAHLAGWSGGARSLITFSVAYPERVRTLALIGPPAYWAGEEAALDDE